MVIWLLACAPPPPTELRFVRGGVLRDGVYEARAWAPGETIDGVVAPREPECVPVATVDLEDMRKSAAIGAPLAGAALDFAADGRLAIGSQGGTVVVLRPDGTELVRTRLAEAAVKTVAWSADGATLFVGEQSPDARLYAMDPTTLVPRWTLRLADDLETSAPPAADDIYGIYSLPSAYDLATRPDGTVIVAGAHGWTTDGVRRNRSRVWKIGADGKIQAAWPPEGALDAVLMRLAVHGDTALVPVTRSADGPPPALPSEGVVALDLTTMALRWSKVFTPLTPWFSRVFIWDAVGLDARTAFVGLGDGRTFLLGADGSERAALSLGVPVEASGVPIAAGVGFGALAGGEIVFATTETNIPFGSADPALRPPSAHPQEYTLHAVGADGTPRWSRSPGVAIAGVVPSPDGSLLLVGGGPRTADSRADAYGARILDRATGKTVTSCATEGPAYFRPVWAEDGRIAVTEGPHLVDGAVIGQLRVTVFR